VSATVTGEDLAVADGLATGLLAAGRDGLAIVRCAGYEAMVIEPDATLRATADFPLADDRGGP
jgi:thiamine biosynthesis lipoprotein ApbE